jgi:hypothetical protein
MKNRTFKKASALIALGLVASIITAPASRAETFVFQGGPLTNLDPAGATIRGGFTSFPAGVGMYIQQCIAPVGTARPATCSDSIQLWVSDSGERGTISSKGDISLKVMGSITGKGTTVDCTTSSCGLFFRLDHTKPTDLSQDKFLPITFKAGTSAPALAADEVTVTLNGKTLVRNVPGQLAYQAPATVTAVAKSGLPVTLSSLTPDCVYANGKFTALKGAGQCALAHSTAGNAMTAPSVANYPFILIPGTQVIEGLPQSMKLKSSKALPAETTFGSAISYTPLGQKCRFVDGVVTSTKRGTCVLRAKADAKTGMWNALSTVVKVAITK